MVSLNYHYLMEINDIEYSVDVVMAAAEVKKAQLKNDIKVWMTHDGVCRCDSCHRAIGALEYYEPNQ